MPELSNLSSNNADLETTLKEYSYHNLEFLLYLNLKKDEKLFNLPLFNRLKHSHLLTIRDNILKQREFININNAFKAAEIPMVPIKGMALLYDSYQDSAFRPMCDIDILIKKEDLKKSTDILLNLGYKISTGSFSENYYYNHYHHMPFYGKYFVELHWDLASPRPNRIHLPKIWDRLKSIQCEEGVITLLSPEDAIFSFALHLRRFNNPLSLRNIYDVYKIIEKYNERLDWRYISSYSKSNRLDSLMYYTLASVKIILNYPIPDKILRLFYPGISRAFLLKFLINKSKRDGIKKLRKSHVFRKYVYVFLRFLLYDRTLDFIKFIIFMPAEEFSRFCNIDFLIKGNKK